MKFDSFISSFLPVTPVKTIYFLAIKKGSNFTPWLRWSHFGAILVESRPPMFGTEVFGECGCGADAIETQVGGHSC